MAVTVHSTAIVSPKAELGEGVVIGPYCVIDGNVRIGENSVLHSFVRILDYVEIGRNCRIFENAVIGREPQDFGFGGEVSWVRIGNDVTLRENVTIHRATGEENATVVGDNCYLMEGVHAGHNVVIGNRVTMANKVGLAGHSSVGDCCVIGGMTGIHQFVRIGRFCMVGGASKVVKDVPHFLMVDGHPARTFGINRIGLRRGGVSAADRASIKAIYRKLYRSGLPFREALSVIESEMPEDSLAEEIIEFVRLSKRGIVPWPKASHRDRS